jgi:flagellar protein FliO/FliZ
MMRLFILLYLLVCNTVFAVEKNAGPPELDVTSMLASLLLVIVCIFVFAYLMKQSNLLNSAKGRGQIKVIASLPLSSKGRVQMIEINGQQYLLGVTEQNITLLDKLDNPLVIEKTNGKKRNATPFSIFYQK